MSIIRDELRQELEKLTGHRVHVSEYEAKDGTPRWRAGFRRVATGQEIAVQTGYITETLPITVFPVFFQSDRDLSSIAVEVSGCSGPRMACSRLFDAVMNPPPGMHVEVRREDGEYHPLGEDASVSL